MNKFTIDIEGRFIDNITDEAKDASKSITDVGKDAETAQKKVDKLGKETAKPTIDADDSKFMRKLNKADAKMNRLKKATADLTLSLKDKASAKISKVLSSLNNFRGRTWTAILKFKDSEAIASLKKIDSFGKDLRGKTWTTMVKIKDLATSPLRAIRSMLFSIQSLVMAITAGLAAKQLIINPIGVADAYSSAKISFSTLLGGSQGQQMMDDLDDFAKATPFNTTNVIENAQKMLAMGWDAENIIGDMEVIGNAAAATGKLDQGLESIVRALSQIKTKGKLSSEELNQLAEAGIAAKAMLAEQLGYGTGDTGIAKMTKDLEDGKIASDKAIAALLAGMQKYDGMMDSMANETVEGLASQIKDAFNINIVRKWGQGLQDGAKRGFGSVVDLLDKAEGSLEKFGDTVYEIGKSFSNWAADKFENAVKRITDITDSYEFDNATLKEKFAMLWKGVITDPLKEWWESGGQEKTAETAGEIGAWLGKSITSGLLAIFGMTDILADGNFETDESGNKLGMSVAQSFADGFKANFDGSAITDAFVDAISDVWGALPTWAKVLIGGYGAAKLTIGASNLIGGVSSIVNTLSPLVGGFSIANSALPHITSAGTGILGAVGKAGVGLGAATTGTALLTGAAGIAGGLAGGASLIKGGVDLYKGYHTDDKVEAAALKASGNATIGGALGGAAIGTAILPGLGTLIGAGIGGIAGWIGGDKWADSIREAQYHSEEMKEAVKDTEMSSEELAAIWEKSVWERARGIFGDIELSASEIAALSQKIVIGDKAAAMDEFAAATSQAEASLTNLKNAASALDKWNWKAGLGLALDADEQEEYRAAIDDYINSAQSYLENKQYEFTASVKILMDTSEGSTGAEIIKGNDAFYADLQKQVEGYSTQLQELMSSALENGKLDDVIDIKIDGENFTVDEQSAIEMLQEKIANIVNSINSAEEQAQLDMIEVKFKTSGISYDSYEQLQAGIDAYKETALGNLDEAQLNVLTNLNLRLDKAQTDEEKAKIQAQIDETLESYGISVSELNANIDSFILTLAADNFSADDLLGADAMEQINQLLSDAVKEGIQPGELTGEDVIRILGLENFDSEAAQVLADMLNNLNFDDEEWTVDTVVGVNITGEKNIQNTIEILKEDFDIPEEQAEVVALLLTGDKQILEKIDTETLAAELGVPPDVAETIITKLKGSKSIEERVTVLGTDLVSDTEVWQTITVNLKAKVGKIVDKVKNYFGGDKEDDDGGGFRGGIFGGTGSMDSFYRGGIAGYSDGGIVQGGTKFIKVAEEGSPEMVIPLSAQRRDRGRKLWAKAGEMLKVPGFNRGGSTIGQNEGYQVPQYEPGESTGSQTVQVNVGGVHLEINVDGAGNQNMDEAIMEAIKARSSEITEIVAGALADALGPQFENTPVRGGA